MLHLFTGHAPYEDILEDVVCPDNLKTNLKKVWKQKSHNIIHNVDEEETLCNTLYRFFVLFGVQEEQFGDKGHRKVWDVINSTLLPPKRARSKKSQSPDVDVFNNDTKQFSLACGTDKRIANARRRLQVSILFTLMARYSRY